MKNINRFTVGSREEIYLRPGEWHFGGPPGCIRTTLGSCIAVTVWHPGKRLGGMCHFMLPRRLTGGRVVALDGRYADEALVLLSNAAIAYGVSLADCEIKLFGAAGMFAVGGKARSRVAADNIAAAYSLVSQYRLRIAAESLGGYQFRQVIFSLAEGEIWMRHGKRRADSARFILEP